MPRIYDKSDYEEIKFLRDQGMSQRKIGQILGMDKSCVALILANPDKYNQEEKEPPPGEFFEHDKYYINL